jgi:SARP family transcriptional regulator, regulator of embCAB operon
MGNAEVMDESARVQLCGTFVVELLGRRVDNLLPGRQGRLLFAYLVVSRLLPVSRNSLIDALWGDAPPADAGGALNALISKTRAVVGGDVLRGRSELILTLPEPAQVDVEAALSKLHVAESAVAMGDWRRAWTPSLSAVFVTRRTLPA